MLMNITIHTYIFCVSAYEAMNVPLKKISKGYYYN